MSDKKSDIIKLLLEYPQGLKAREISKKLLYIDKKEVNQILYGNPSDFVSNDYVWSLTKTKSNEASYKNTEIEKLQKKYIIPYNAIKDIKSLDLLDFKRAINHAKILNENNLTYYVGENWFNIVNSSEITFVEKISECINKRNIEREKVLQENKRIEDSKKIKDEAILNLCNRFNLPKDTYEYLISQDISESEVEQRIFKIHYYETHFPELKISISKYIRMSSDNFNKLIQDKFSKPVKKCYGDCSSCQRDICIENS